MTAGGFPPTEQLLLDEESLAACWAWERFYDGMEVAGTIFNELAVTGSGTAASIGEADRSFAGHPRGGIPQNEPSGGGREVSSLRRTYLKGRPAESTERIRQSEGDGFRRTLIRREPAEVRAAGVRLAEEASDMVDRDIHTYPSPAPEHCSACAFVAPCLLVDGGDDAASVLAAGYRERPPVEIQGGRLGGSPFGVGRGWVPGTGRK